jgi:hypothetical protein
LRGWAPGGRGPLAPLQEMRRQSYEQARKQIDMTIAERKRMGVPLDDETDWRTESARAGEMANAINAQDTARYRLALETALIATRGGLAPLPPFEPDPRLEGIEARFRTVPRRVWWATVGRQQELTAREALLDKNGLQVDGGLRGQILADLESARAELVKHALVELRGVEGADFYAAGDEPQSDHAIGVLVESGLLLPLFLAARDFQSLDPEGRRRFGLQPPPTSQSSTASGAQSDIESYSAATAAQPLGTSEGPDTRPTCALDVDSFDIRGLPMPSPSGGPPTAERSASTAPS